MALTRWHRKPLQNYHRWHRDGGPTFFGVFHLSLKGHIAFATLIAAVLVWFYYTSNAETLFVMSLIAGGMFLGALLHDVANTFALIRFWRTLDQVIDWQRVDAALGE